VDTVGVTGGAEGASGVVGGAAGASGTVGDGIAVVATPSVSGVAKSSVAASVSESAAEIGTVASAGPAGVDGWFGGDFLPERIASNGDVGVRGALGVSSLMIVSGPPSRRVRKQAQFIGRAATGSICPLTGASVVIRGPELGNATRPCFCVPRYR
jgi:hypothetical protein